MNIRKTLANLVLGASLAASPYLVQTSSTSYAAQQSQAGVIDLQPAGGGRYVTQKNWIPFFNEKGIAMISSPDVYRAGQIGARQLVEEVHMLITSTRIIYNSDGLTAKIIHNYGSTIVEPTEKQIKIPIYEKMNLKEALPLTLADALKLDRMKELDADPGLQYLRALFDTDDSPENIILTLQILSGGKDIDKILLVTSLQGDRKRWPEVAVRFYSGVEGFQVICDGSVDDDHGHSYGVSVK